MAKNCKTIVLASGREEGALWSLKLDVCRRIETFSGYFQLFSEEQMRRNRIRSKDRSWFKRHLGSCFMCDKQVHHDWENEEKCYVLTKKEHMLADESIRVRGY